MRINFKGAGLVATASALAIAVPAAAHPSSSDHPTATNHPNGSSHSEASHPSASHRCTAHQVAYIVYGTIDAKQALAPIVVAPGGKVPSGTLDVDVKQTNHWARQDKPSSPSAPPISYTLGPKTMTKFEGGTTGFVTPSNERVKLIGKATVVTNPRCRGAGEVGTPTFRMVVVHPAAS